MSIHHEKIKVAILDMYLGHANQGMRGIKDILERYGKRHDLTIDYKIFDVRGSSEVPDIDAYNVFISTGGPGSPTESEGSEWEKVYFQLMENILSHNRQQAEQKKYVFLICHSFQVFCRYFQLGRVTPRKSTSFGVMPCHKTEAGKLDKTLNGLSDPFYIVDSRDWQVIEPNAINFMKMGAEVLALEKYRPHVKFEQALMAVRFTPEVIGTQFHPEADAIGMSLYLKEESKRDHVILHHGEEKYHDMLTHLNDPDKIMLTQRTILPAFLDQAIGAYKPEHI